MPFFAKIFALSTVTKYGYFIKFHINWPFFSSHLLKWLAGYATRKHPVQWLPLHSSSTSTPSWKNPGSTYSYFGTYRDISSTDTLRNYTKFSTERIYLKSLGMTCDGKIFRLPEISIFVKYASTVEMYQLGQKSIRSDQFLFPKNEYE